MKTRQEKPTIRRAFDPPIASLSELASLLTLPEAITERLIEDSPTLYTSFPIPKASGGTRTITPPRKRLREVQRVLLDKLQERVSYPRWMTGGIPKRSIFDHARPHVAREMVATFDVRSFFPNTSTLMVESALTRLGFKAIALSSTIRLVMKDGGLPQGGPTSLFLANLCLEPADRRIDAIARKHSLNFTRYVDDVALSGPNDVRQFASVVIEAIESCGYEVEASKVKFMSRSVAQVVTKLQVNHALRPTKAFITDVKELIWNCLNVGALMTATERGQSVNRLKNSLNGRIGHIRAADPNLAGELREMMYGVNWISTPAIP